MSNMFGEGDCKYTQQLFEMIFTYEQPYLKRWLKVNVQTTLLNENSTRKSVGQKMGGFLAVELNVFSACNVHTPVEQNSAPALGKSEYQLLRSARKRRAQAL